MFVGGEGGRGGGGGRGKVEFVQEGLGMCGGVLEFAVEVVDAGELGCGGGGGRGEHGFLSFGGGGVLGCGGKQWCGWVCNWGRL